MRRAASAHSARTELRFVRSISSHCAAVIESIGRPLPDAVVGHEDVERPERLLGRGDEPLGLAVPGQVGPEGDRGGAGRLHVGDRLRAPRPRRGRRRPRPARRGARRATHTARPMPRLPPVTSAVFPARLSMGVRRYPRRVGASRAPRPPRRRTGGWLVESPDAVHHVRGDRGLRQEHAAAAAGRAAGRRGPCVTREPGGTAIGRAVRQVLLDPASRGLTPDGRASPLLRRPGAERGRGGAARRWPRAGSSCATATSSRAWPTRATAAGWTLDAIRGLADARDRRAAARRDRPPRRAGRGGPGAGGTAGRARPARGRRARFPRAGRATATRRWWPRSRERWLRVDGARAEDAVFGALWSGLAARGPCWETPRVRLADVRGHDRIRPILARALERDRLPPALLFAGPDGVGKKTLALAVAQAALCERAPVPEPAASAGRAGRSRPPSARSGWRSCREEADQHPDEDVWRNFRLHPDLVLVEGWWLTRTGRPRSEPEIRVDQVRDLVGEIAGAPFEARRRVFVVDDAHTMNEAAQNALLKSLEEPPPRSHVILVTARRPGLRPDDPLALPAPALRAAAARGDRRVPGGAGRGAGGGGAAQGRPRRGQPGRGPGLRVRGLRADARSRCSGSSSARRGSTRRAAWRRPRRSSRPRTRRSSSPPCARSCATWRRCGPGRGPGRSLNPDVAARLAPLASGPLGGAGAPSGGEGRRGPLRAPRLREQAADLRPPGGRPAGTIRPEPRDMGR